MNRYTDQYADGYHIYIPNVLRGQAVQYNLRINRIIWTSA